MMSKIIPVNEKEKIATQAWASLVREASITGEMSRGKRVTHAHGLDTFHESVLACNFVANIKTLNYLFCYQANQLRTSTAITLT